MKIIEAPRIPACELTATHSTFVSSAASTKIQDRHRERLAIVYVRQSSQQQVLEHRESAARQYALANFARSLGWRTERILVFDEDQGSSGTRADNREGFQRLLSELTMDHVGIVLGLEMSRLARSSKDWHHLFEVCGVFGSLLADEDGIYDPNDSNDRLLLGLKGIISEVELHTMRNRLERGKLNKAQRGELFLSVPVGYVKADGGGVAFDPDEQVRSTIHLIFDKFVELGSGHAVHRYLLKHDIRLGVRPIDGPNRGQIEWRRPTSTLLFNILKHPIYAGAYAYGRCPTDPKRRHTHKTDRKWVPPEEWKVLLHDHVPAYITWNQYLYNQQRLQDNRTKKESKGTPRNGLALLSGIAYCGTCGCRLSAAYQRSGDARYECVSYMRKKFEKSCRGVTARSIDALVTQQILLVLEPASLELSIQAMENIRHDREMLEMNWKQQCSRARYEAQRAERHYRAVDPENRLVARTLEQEWEAALRQEAKTKEDFDRFQQRTPTQLTQDEQEQIRQLGSDIPALWRSVETAPGDRKEIIRCLIDRVEINVRGDTEHVDVTITWAGGYVSQHVVVRPVGRYDQLEDYDRIAARIRAGRERDLDAAQIAEHLNREGFRSPAARAQRFTKGIVNRIQNQLGIRTPLLPRDKLGTNEWWLCDLAEELKVNSRRLHHWVRRGYILSRKLPDSKYWILWADNVELERLRQLRGYLTLERHIPYPEELTRPRSGPPIEH